MAICTIEDNEIIKGRVSRWRRDTFWCARALVTGLVLGLLERTSVVIFERSLFVYVFFSNYFVVF